MYPKFDPRRGQTHNLQIVNSTFNAPEMRHLKHSAIRDLVYTLGKQATIHQLTTMLSTSKNVLVAIHL